MRLVIRLVAVVSAALFSASASRAGPQHLDEASRLPPGEILATRLVSAGAGERSDLYVMQPDGSHLRLFSRDAGNAAVTRDGKEIAFVRNRQVWVMHGDRSRPRRVTSPPPSASDDDPAWTPDGKGLYFSRQTGSFQTESASSSIFFVRADGTGLLRLTRAAAPGGFHDLPACHQLPSSSLDGRVVVYTLIDSCSHTPNSSLAAVTSTGHAIPIHPAAPAWATDWKAATWSPTQMEIAYFILAWDPGLRVGLYVSRIDGTHIRHVAIWPHSDTNGWPLGAPAWSPNGAFLAATRAERYLDAARAYAGDVWLLAADGGRPHRLTTTRDYTAQTWLRPVRPD